MGSQTRHVVLSLCNLYSSNSSTDLLSQFPSLQNNWLVCHIGRPLVYVVSGERIGLYASFVTGSNDGLKF